MKKLSILVVLLICIIKINSQTELNFSNFNPRPGDKYGYNDFSGLTFSPGNSGSGQTWNFSGLDSISHSLMEYVTVSSTGLDTAYPSATFALKNGGSGNYKFYSSDNNGISFLGVSINNKSYSKYNDPEKVMSFPFSYNSSFTDSFKTMPTGSGYSKGKINLTADGTGTLILPGGTIFTNTIRVAVLETITDYSPSGFNVGTATLSGYTWYVPGIHVPVLNYTHISSGGSPSYYAYYLDRSSRAVGISKKAENSEALRIFPNPCASQLQIQYHSSGILSGSVLIYDCNGKSVKEIILRNVQEEMKIIVDLSGLPIGIYFLHLQQGVINLSRKIILE